jgi:nondiscriminating aspartyl-tRNA synthetase
MERVLANEVAAHTGDRVRIAGWLHHQRQLSQVAFALVRDRSGIVQVVLDDAAQRATVAELPPETVVEVEGTVRAVEQAPGGVELHEPTVRVISPAVAPPIELRRPTLKEQLPMLLDHAPVALRHPPRRAIAQITAASTAGFRATLDSLGFTEIHTPKIVASATESGANVFAIDFFGRPAYLAQSPQLHKQMLVGVLERVYEVGPVFRAEPHDTVRHLAEYTSLDVELGFIDGPEDVMAILRAVLAGMVESVRERCDESVARLGIELPVVPATIPAIDFYDAQQLIEHDTGERVTGEPDLAPAHERWLGSWAQSEHGSDLLFVSGYPMAKRPFYTQHDPERPEQSKSFDLLFRGLELVTGGQRLHRADDYERALRARGEDPALHATYLSAFRHGMPPHGGFAIGLERWVARLVGAANVREVTLFPRDRTRLTP